MPTVEIENHRMAEFMTNVVAIRPDIEARLWKVRFADSVIAMCPDINPDAADEASDNEIRSSSRLDPVTAAKRWVAAKIGPASPELPRDVSS
jgi:hypothetical protein